MRADVGERTRVTTRREWVMTDSVTGGVFLPGEVQMVIGWALQSLPEDQRDYDDAVEVRPSDDTLIVSVETDRVTGRDDAAAARSIVATDDMVARAVAAYWTAVPEGTEPARRDGMRAAVQAALNLLR